MKTMKKLASLLLALAMIFALATTAFADTKNDSITVNKAQAGETYKLYKLFDLKVDLTVGEKGAYSYSVTDEWEAFFTGTGAGATYVTIENGYVTAISDAAALAKAAAAWTGKPTETQKKEADGESVTFEGLADGYWLITSTLGTVAMTETTPDKNAVTINEKNEVPTQEKKVQEEKDSSWVDSSDGEIGETVNYKVTIQAKKGTTKYVLHDKMTDGLTFDSSSVVVTKDGQTVAAANNWELVTEGLDDGCDFEIKLNFLNGAAADSVVVVSYSATINANAVIAGVGNKNESFLKYGDAGETTHEEVTTYVWKFPVFKYTGTNKTPLAGAKFSLYKDANYQNIVNLTQVTGSNTYKVAATGITEIVTDTTGKFVIEGLDSGTYYLKEIDAPDGYNKLTAAIEVEIDNNGDIKQDGTDTTEIGVENNTGTELPSTGGMGTTLFYVVGGILVAAAAVLLVTKKRMAN